MINFRYHLVSLTAVFLALAIGLVLGTAALNGPAVDLLNDQVSSLRTENQQYRDSLNQLESQLENEEEFAKQVGPIALSGKLADKQVLVLSVAGVDEEHVDGALEMLGYGGATITGQVQMTDNFTDPSNNDELLDLVTTVTPKNLPLNALPNNSDGVETSAALLAQVLMSTPTEITAEEQTKVLTAFNEVQLLTGEDTISDGRRAQAVLIMTGATYTDSNAAQRNTNLVTLTEQFDTAGVAVLAAPSIGDGNAVTVIRNDPALNESVSTVDNVSTPQGQLAAALAVADELAGKAPGDYGTGEGATALVPPLAS